MIKNQSGSVLLQALFATAVLGGAAAYYVTTTENNLKLSKGLVAKTNRSVIAAELGQAFSLVNVCTRSISNAGGIIIDGLPVPAILNASGVPMYRPGDKLLGQEILEFTLDMPPNYIADNALKAVDAKFKVKTMILEDRSQNKGSFAAVEKFNEFPIFMILYMNQVVNCVTDDTNSMLESLRNACYQLEGTFNDATLRCEELHGAQGYPFLHVSSFFCNPVSGVCPHPYASQSCVGTDSRGANHNNYYFKGFNPDGSKACECMPVKACQDPMNYCLGVDLGTNGCIECGVGVNWTSGCNPLPPT